MIYPYAYMVLRVVCGEPVRCRSLRTTNTSVTVELNFLNLHVVAAVVCSVCLWVRTKTQRCNATACALIHNFVWLIGEAARLLCLLRIVPVDDRNILTAVRHHPVTVERWMLERQPCQPLHLLTVHLRDARARVHVRWYSASRYSALSCFH